MALKNCIKITSGLNSDDVTAVLDSFDSYKESMSQEDAAVLAVEDAIASLEVERQGMMASIDAAYPEIAKEFRAAGRRIVLNVNRPIEETEAAVAEMKAKQAGWTIDDHYKQAHVNQVDLNEIAADISENIGIEYKHAPARHSESAAGEKSRSSTARKVKEKYYGNAEKLTDIVRGTFILESPSDVEAIVDQLGDRLAGVDEGWAITDTGYFDRKILVQFDNGQIGELQLVTKNIIEAKEGVGLHDIYSDWRENVSVNPKTGMEEIKNGKEFFADLQKRSMIRGYAEAIGDETNKEWLAVYAEVARSRLSTQLSKELIGIALASRETSRRLTGTQAPSIKAAAEAAPSGVEKVTAGKLSKEKALTGLPSGKSIVTSFIRAAARRPTVTVGPPTIPQTIIRNGKKVALPATGVDREPSDFIQHGEAPKTKPKIAISIARLNRLVKNLQRDYHGMRKITFHIIPTQVAAFGKNSVSEHGIIKGGFYSGTDEIVLIAENIKDYDDAIKVLRHEIVGHYGLREVLNGDGQYDKLLDRVYKAKDGELKELYDWVEASYPDLIDSNDVRKIADEMLARAAETKTDSNLLKWIYDQIIKLLNAVGLVRDTINQAEVESLIRLSEASLRRKIRPRGDLGVPFAEEQPENVYWQGVAPISTDIEESQAQLDLFSPKNVEKETARAQATDNFRLRYKQVEVGKIRTGITTVTSAEDAAHVLAPIRKHAQETMTAAVLDKDNKVISVIRNAKGTKGSANIAAVEIASAIAATEGATSVWLAHNHPSGSIKPSDPDIHITGVINDALDGSGVEVNGHLVIGAYGKAGTMNKQGDPTGEIKIRPAPRKETVSVTERVVRKNTMKEDTTKLISTSEVVDFVKESKTKNGLILMNTSHQIIGVLSMTSKEMKKLRDGKQIPRILKTLDETNAGAVIILSSNAEAIGNMSRYLAVLSGLRVLDAVISKGAATVSYGAVGDLIPEYGPFYSKTPATDAQINTPEFKAWFGDSKVVDEDGSPKVVFHGNNQNILIDIFNPEIGAKKSFGGFFNTMGSWFTDNAQQAAGFSKAYDWKTKKTRSGGTYPVYLSFQNPMVLVTSSRNDAWQVLKKEFMEVTGVEHIMDATQADQDKYLAWVRKQGYDGIILKNTMADSGVGMETGEGGPNDWYIALDPKKIKSAIGNIGRFDATDPRIMFSRAATNANNAPVGQSLGMPEETLTEKFVRLAQDAFSRVKTLQETILARGGLVRPEADVYRAEERSSGRIASRLEQIDKQYMRPLLELMKEKNISIDELDTYLVAKHAQERNRYIASINDDMPDGGSGMTNQEAADILASYAHRQADMEAAAAIVYTVNNRSLDDMVAGGHLDADTVDEWKSRWKYYVPLKGKEGEEQRPGLGRGFSVTGAGIKKAMGRGAGNIAESPTAHTFAQAEATIVRTEKTKVGQALVNLMRDNPDPDFWTVTTRTYKKFEDLYGEPFEGYEEPPEGMIENLDYRRVTAITKEERAAAKAEGRKPVGKVVYMIDRNYKHRDDVFAVMVEGEELLIQIKDQVLMEQLKKMNSTQLNAVVAGFGMLNRYLAMINTALNPEFVITNFERDFQTAMINLGGEHSPEIAAKVMKNIPQAVRGIWQATFETKGQSVWRELFNEMKDQGGAIGFFGLEDIDTKVKKIQQRLIERHGVLGRTKQGILAVRDVVLDANLSVENAARLAAYKVIKDEAIARGKSPAEAMAYAASISKNLTVNFNRKGELAPVLNSAYLFYNASIQGSARIITALKNPRVRKIVAGVAATAFALAMYNRNAGGDDDDEIPYWDKISDYTKQTNLIIMHPDGSGNYTKIKLPYGYNVFFYSGIAMHDMMFNERMSAARTTMNMISAGLNAFNPIQGADMLDTITPTFLKPFEQDARNINFMGTPLKPEFPFDAYERPDSQKYFKSTNPQLREMMALINEATGGDETHSGMIDISPEIAKHYISWLTGGAGMTATRTLETAANIMAGEEVEQKGVPFLRTLGGKPGPHYDTERYYNAVKEIAAVEAQLKLYRGTDRWAEYREEHKEVHKLSLKLKKYKNKVKRLREQRDKAYKDEDLDLANDKREEIRQTMMEFSLQYEQAVEAEAE